MTTAVAREIHPLADLVPGMTDEEYAELRDDIAANGLLDEITMFEGKVLDGRHRLRACEEAGVEPRFSEYDGEAPASYVLSHNLHRRNLTESQKAMLAVEFLPAFEKERKARSLANLRQGDSPTSHLRDIGKPQGLSSAQAAESTGSAARTVQQAKRIKDADPELAAKVLTGEIKVGTAERQVAAREKGETIPKPEPGSVRPAAVARIAEQALGMAMALESLNVTKSCERMTEEERNKALDSCKTGLRALNTMARALGR